MSTKTKRDGGSTGGSESRRLRIVSSKDFVADFEPPDYLIDGVVMRRFLYSLTGRTGKTKQRSL
jgi:hypothetical protein